MVGSPPSCPPFSAKCLWKIQNSAISYVRVNLFQLFDATGFCFVKEHAAMTKPKLIEEPSICNFLPDKSSLCFIVASIYWTVLQATIVLIPFKDSLSSGVKPVNTKHVFELIALSNYHSLITKPAKMEIMIAYCSS